MASYKFSAIIGVLLVSVTIVIQSAPIEQSKSTVQSSSIDNNIVVDQPVDSEKSSTSDVPSEEKKKKRFIEDDLLDDSDSDENNNNNNNHVLHTNIQETSAQIHDNADKPVNTDDSEIYSESQMTPNQLSNVLRQRRNVKLNEQSNGRHKRALTPFDFYETNTFYDPYADLIEQQEYDRPLRSFAPLYWYPNVYERSLRSALTPSFYESSESPRLYSSTIYDDDDDNPDLLDDDEEDYELNRYPILIEKPDFPFDNYELQQQYNIDDLPIDENLDDTDEELDGYNNDDDDDEEEYHTFYPRERSHGVWVY